MLWTITEMVPRLGYYLWIIRISSADSLKVVPCETRLRISDCPSEEVYNGDNGFDWWILYERLDLVKRFNQSAYHLHLLLPNSDKNFSISQLSDQLVDHGFAQSNFRVKYSLTHRRTIAEGWYTELVTTIKR